MGLYNIDENVVVKNDTVYIEAGIRENLKLTAVNTQTTENNNFFLSFYFEDPQGRKLSHTEWPQKFSKPIEEMSDDEKVIFMSRLNKQKGRIVQIVEAYVGTGKFRDLNFDTFEQFAQKVVEVLTPFINGPLVRAKVVYDWRNYTSLLNNPRYTFIESMDIAKEQTNIFLLQNDKLVKTFPDKINEPKVDLLGTDVVQTEASKPEFTLSF